MPRPILAIASPSRYSYNLPISLQPSYLLIILLSVPTILLSFLTTLSSIPTILPSGLTILLPYLQPSYLAYNLQLVSTYDLPISLQLSCLLATLLFIPMILLFVIIIMINRKVATRLINFIFFIHYSHGADSAMARLSKALTNQDK